MKKVIAYLRMEEWLSSKVTMMLGILMYFLYLSNSSTKKSLIDVLIYFLFLGMFLAISYVANDFSDLEIDKKVGKRKVIVTMRKWQIWMLFIVMFLVGNVPIFFVREDKCLVTILIIVVYILGVSYSAPGIRFKERGLIGLVECSFAQRCMPLCIICLLVDMNPRMCMLLGIWGIVSLLDGLRYILIHQIIDMENDLKSGVNTFITNRQKNYRSVVVAFWVTEIILCLIALIPLFLKNSVLVIVFVLLNFVLERWIYIVLCKYAQKDWFTCFDSVPLEAFLNIFLPVMAGIALTIQHVELVILPLGILVICAKSIKVKLDIANVYLKSLKDK